jgi:hypothetical protein
MRKRNFVPAAVVATVGLGAVAYAAIPNVFSTGDLLSSSKLNANFSNLDSRLTNLESTELGEQFVNDVIFIGNSPAIVKPPNATAGQGPVVLSIPPGRKGQVLINATYTVAVFHHQQQSASTAYEIVTCCLSSGGVAGCQSTSNPTATGGRDVVIPSSTPTFNDGSGGPDLMEVPGAITHMFSVDTRSANTATPFEADLVCYIRKQSTPGLVAEIVSPMVTGVFLPTN